MKRLIIGFSFISISSFAFADGRYEIKTDPYGSSTGGGTEIEMRKKNEYGPAKKYRGEIDSDGSVQMKDMDGDRLRGTIDSYGYGRLRDQDGNTYRVRPR